MNINDIVNIDTISPDTNFWMVRTKNGYYHDEYLEGKFVALGWNIITKEMIDKYNKIEKRTDKDAYREFLKDLVAKHYPNVKNPMLNINKCNRFIHEMKENDILMIIGKKSELITFARAGEYYEENEFTPLHEIEADKQINEGHDRTSNVKCPYIKKRKIEVLKTVESRNVNPNLFRALVSYHGLSNTNEYGSFILSSIFSCYTWKNQLNMVFRVNKVKNIDTYDFSGFLFNSAYVLKQADENINIYTKTNVNSPGDIVLTIENTVSGIVHTLSNPLFIACLAFLWTAISGGKWGNKEFKSLWQFLSERSELEHNAKMKNAELVNKELDNKLKEEELKLNKLKNQEYENKFKELQEYAHKLEIDNEEISNIVNLSELKSKKD